MSIIGIDLGGTNIRVGLIRNNNLVKIETLPVRKTNVANDVVDDLSDLIKKFDFNEIEGIGIGVPGVVDVERGIVYDVQNIPSWKEVHIKKILGKKFNVPVNVNNDANCFAIGEKYFGKGKNFQNIVGLIIGTGLGAGIAIQGKLYSGKNCAAGEFGGAPYKNKNYEYYCSGQYFVNEHNTTGEELYKRASLNDDKALSIFADYGANLGEAIKLVLYTIDPEIIILGGSVSKSFNHFKNEMYKSINNFSFHKSVSNLRIEVSEISNVAVLGAAALYYDYMQN